MGGNAWVRGEVLTYNALRRVHLVLYEDGESEWIDMDAEALQMLPALSWVPGLPSGAPREQQSNTITVLVQGGGPVGIDVQCYWATSMCRCHEQNVSEA